MNYFASKRTTTAFVKLLQKAFPSHENLPNDCVVSLAIANNQDAFQESIEIIDRFNATREVIQRLRRSHPDTSDHSYLLDEHYWAVWTEVFAFAWSVEQGHFRNPEFTDDNGKPDLKVGPNLWLEAKTVRPSDKESMQLREMGDVALHGQVPLRMVSVSGEVHPTLIKKFNDGLTRAVHQLRNRSGQDLIVFFNVERIDLETDETSAIQAIRHWAYAKRSSGNPRIVVIHRDQWKSPLVDTGP